MSQACCEWSTHFRQSLQLFFDYYIQHIAILEKHVPTCLLKAAEFVRDISSERYLLAQETNHQYVFFLMDIFNNIIQYQYGGNAHLIYAIIRRRDSFDRLFNLSLPDKITEASTNDTAQAESAADDEVKTDANPIDIQIKKQPAKGFIPTQSG